MTNFTNTDLSNDSKIRKTVYKGEHYYGIIDIISVVYNVDMLQARNYYHVLKNRLERDGINLPIEIKKLKLRSQDLKFRLTDCTDINGVKFIQDYLQVKARKKYVRTNHRMDDEIVNFHPMVIAHFEGMGGKLQQHIRLPSGKVIDFIIELNDIIYIAECKPKLSDGQFFKAVGQVLCYCSEYRTPALPTIVTYYLEKNDYARQRSAMLGIHFVEV